MKINGIELEFNGLNADQMERAEQAIDKVSKEMESLKTGSLTRTSQLIRGVCGIVFECFNTIFGDGTDKKVFGDTCDMGKALDAFGQLTAQLKTEGVEKGLNNLIEKYTPNRQQRRTAKK